jgi:hypothetical protein
MDKNGRQVTFWLGPEAASLIDQCMDGYSFVSLSEFFEAALLVFRDHTQALLDYIEQEEAKGFTHEEIFGLLKTEITFRRLDN